MIAEEYISYKGACLHLGTLLFYNKIYRFCCLLFGRLKKDICIYVRKVVSLSAFCAKMKELKITDIELQGVKAVIFDLDGTLYNKRFLPLRLILGDLKNTFLLASERNARRQLKGLEFGDADTFYRTLFTHISQYQHVPYMTARDWYFGKYLPLTISILEKHYKAGEFVKPLLSELRQRGIRTMVFSDYRCVDEKLQALGIDPNWFDYREAAMDLGGLKPNKKLFQRLLQLLGTAPEETLMIGDREDTDGAGAKKVGMKFLKV